MILDMSKKKTLIIMGKSVEARPANNKPAAGSERRPPRDDASQTFRKRAPYGGDFQQRPYYQTLAAGYASPQGNGYYGAPPSQPSYYQGGYGQAPGGKAPAAYGSAYAAQGYGQPSAGYDGYDLSTAGAYAAQSGFSAEAYGGQAAMPPGTGAGVQYGGPKGGAQSRMILDFLIHNDFFLFCFLCFG